MTTPYSDVTFENEQPTRAKFQKLATNQRWLFENTPKIRYSGAGLTRDVGLKIIAGKTPYSPSTTDYLDLPVFFGTFFTVGCNPIVVAVVADSVSGRRRRLDVRAHGGPAIDHIGFIAHVVAAYQKTGINQTINSSGWVHWIAVGY